MKKILSLLLAGIALTACKDYLDVSDADMNTVEKIFSQPKEAMKWYNRLFSKANNDVNNKDSWGFIIHEIEHSAYEHPWLFATDDAMLNRAWHIQDWWDGTVNASKYDSSNGLRGWEIIPFDRFYQAIRHANIFLENIDKTPFTSSNFEPEKRDIWKADAKFMRAMYHFWILRCYGPIPIVTESRSITESGVKTARWTMDECVDWLDEEFKAAMKEIVSKRNNLELGLPTGVGAAGIRSRLLLMAASPLYNGNKVYTNWKNPDGTHLISQSYDAGKWKYAAEAALECIELAERNGYKLTQPDINGNMTQEEKFEAYINNYRTLTTLWNLDSPEILWARPQNAWFYNNYCMPGVFQGWSGNNGVTIELANSYFMADGTKVTPEMEAEWFANPEFSSAEGLGTVANTFKMFCDREPRFYASVHFPNQKVDYSQSKNKPHILEFYYTGNSGHKQSTSEICHTGMSVRKNLHPNLITDKTDTYRDSPITFPIVRLAEVYLNYCEAMNEFYGPAEHGKVLGKLNAIRERAGIPGYDTSVSYTKEEMRDMIWQERRVELAWETHRFFDARRWFIAHGANGVFNKPVHGFDIMKGESPTDASFFKKTQVDARHFQIQHYFYPVNSSECAFNSSLVQAPFY